MPKTSDPGRTKKGLFALIKGAPNTGKSVAVLSFPNPFIFDFDRKMPTVAEKHYPGKEFSWESFDDVFQISDFLKPWQLATPEGPTSCPYETLIIDTVSSLSTICLKSLDKTKGTDVVQMMSHLSKDRDGVKSVEVMGIDYYNAEFNFFERWFMDWLKILWARDGNPKHILVIAHETTVESGPDLKTGIIKRTSSILTAGRKAAVFIPKCFDEEYVIKVERPTMGDTMNRTKRLLITSSELDEDARTCYKFPEKIDFSKINLYDELNKVALWS